MPRRALLSQAQRDALFALPATEGEWLRYYTLTDSDLAVIAQRRGGHNRLGFAVQLCYLRYPGLALHPEEAPAPDLLAFVAKQLRLDPKLWLQYAQRPQTRREHGVWGATEQKTDIRASSEERRLRRQANHPSISWDFFQAGPARVNGRRRNRKYA